MVNIFKWYCNTFEFIDIQNIWLMLNPATYCTTHARSRNTNKYIIVNPCLRLRTKFCLVFSYPIKKKFKLLSLKSWNKFDEWSLVPASIKLTINIFVGLRYYSTIGLPLWTPVYQFSLIKTIEENDDEETNYEEKGKKERK